MQDVFQKVIRNKVITAIVSFLFGLVLIIWRAGAVAEIIRILGYLMLAGAAFSLVGYFFGRQTKGNPSTLASAVLGIIFGIVFVNTPGWLITLFPVVMGVVLILNGILNASALMSAPVKAGAFAVGMVLSILTLILGIVAVMHPMQMANMLILFMGVTYVVNGISDLIAIALLP